MKLLQMCAIFFWPKVILDQMMAIHGWETTHCRDNPLWIRSRCMRLQLRLALVAHFLPWSFALTFQLQFISIEWRVENTDHTTFWYLHGSATIIEGENLAPYFLNTGQRNNSISIAHRCVKLTSSHFRRAITTINKPNHSRPGQYLRYLTSETVAR